MSKVKLTEKDLRKIVEKLLAEEAPAGPEAAPAVDDNPKAVKINNDNTPGLESQTLDLGTLLDQVAVLPEVPEGGYPSIDEMISREGKLASYAKETGISHNAAFDPSDVEGSRIRLVKTYLKYNIVLALTGNLPNQDVHRLAFFTKDAAYMRDQNDNWPTNAAATYADIARLKSVYYAADSGVRVVPFGSQEFFDLLDKADFVKLLIEQDPWFSPETYGSGVYISVELQAAAAAVVRTELTEIAAKIPKIYEQFDSDYVEEFFCMPLVYPNYWMSVKSPDDHPLYTPWRQTYVMLNILSQAMSIEGGLESLYLKFADFVANGARKQPMSLQPASMDAYSTTVFKSINESRKIMISLKELRRIINAAMLLKEAPSGGGVSAGLGDAARVGVASAEAGGNLLVRAGKSAIATGKDFISAMDGLSGNTRMAIADAVKLAQELTPTRLSRLEALLNASPGLSSKFDDACRDISVYVDNELIGPDFWAIVGGGKSNIGADDATEVVKGFLSARGVAINNNSAVAPLDALITVAKSVEGGDTRRAAELVSGVLERVGDNALITPANLERVKKAVNTAGTTSLAALNAAVTKVKSAIIADIFKNTPLVVGTRGTDRFAISFSFDETVNLIRFEVTQIDTAGTAIGTPRMNVIKIRRSGDNFDRTIREITLTENIDDKVKTDILERLNKAKIAVDGNFSDGNPIADAIIEQAATNNNQGVLRAAYAVLTNASYTKFLAEQGLDNAKKGAFGTAAAIVESKALSAHLADMGIEMKASLSKWWEKTPALTKLNKAFRTTGFVPELIGKAALNLSAYRLFSTTAYGRAFKWVIDRWWGPAILGTFILAKGSKAYRTSVAGTPGEEATAENPTVLNMFALMGEIYRPGPYLNLIQACMDNFFEGGVDGTKPFVVGQPVVGADNGLSAYGTVLAGAAGDLLKALKAYDARLDASPALFDDLLQTASTGGVQEKVNDAAEALSSVSQQFFGLLSLQGTANAEEIISSSKKAAASLQYAIDVDKSSSEATPGNQDWNNLEGTRQAATSLVIAKLQARAGGAAIDTVSVINYKDVLIQLLKRRDEKNVVDKGGLWVASFLTGVDDPAYYDQAAEIITSGVSEDDMMKLYAKYTNPDVAKVDVKDIPEFYEQTYGVTDVQYEALKAALNEISKQTRSQIFSPAAKTSVK